MVKRKVFLQRDVKCPSCKEISKMEYPNPRLYVAAKRDSDMRVIEYRWGEGITETEVLPHHYDIWKCPHCKYADFYNIITNSELVNQSMKVIGEFRKLPPREKRLLDELVRTFDKDDDPQMKALGNHLAALFINYLPSKEDRNHNKIGRIALRLSWLFKEHGGIDNTVKEEKEEEPKTISALGDGSARIEAQLLTLRDIVTELNANAEKRITELGFDPETSTSEDEPYSSLVNSFNDKLEDLNTLNTMLQRVIISDSRTEAESSSEDVNISEDALLTEKLMQLKNFWPEIPVNEDQAVHRSIDAFDYSYNHENVYQSIEQSMAVVALIVDLYSRIGQYREALSYVGEIYRSGMRMKQDLQARLTHARKQKTLSAHDERMINRKMGNINTAIRQAGDKRRELLKIVLTKLTPKINKILSVVKDASQQEQVIALKKNDIPEDIITELKNRKILNPEKKKGLFG